MKQKIIILLIAAFFAGNLYSQKVLSEFVIEKHNNSQFGISQKQKLIPDAGIIVFHTTIPNLEFSMPDTPRRLKSVSAFDEENKCYVLCVQPTDDRIGGITRYSIDITAYGYKRGIVDVSKVRAAEAQYFTVDSKINESHPGNQIRWGIRAGIGYTNSHSTEGVNTKNNVSFEIGPTAYYSFNKNMYINTGLTLNLKRFGIKNDSIESGGGVNYYLELPVNAGMKLNLGKATMYAQAGPFLGIKLQESIMLNTETDGVRGIIPNYFSRFNYGIGVAVGIDAQKFKIELGYQKGMANIVKASKEDLKEDTTDKAYLNTLFIGVSYMF
jgi:opacity protein-like surface antigen